MNTTEAHKQTTPEILNILKGCGITNEYYSKIEHSWKVCGEYLNSGKFILCPECKAKLLGILLAQEKWLLSLEEWYAICTYKEWYAICTYKNSFKDDYIEDKIKELKISNEDLREKLE